MISVRNYIEEDGQSPICEEALMRALMGNPVDVGVESQACEVEILRTLEHLAEFANEPETHDGPLTDIVELRPQSATVTPPTEISELAAAPPVSEIVVTTSSSTSDTIEAAAEPDYIEAE